MSLVSNQNILHIVNDGLTAQALSNAEIPGNILPWQDTLYEGPVTGLGDIDELSVERAKYFASRGFGDFKEIKEAYLARNSTLKDYSEYSQIILWFDYDLYGQLQLIQLVEWLNRQDTGNLEICCIDLLKIKTKVLKKPRISQMNTVDINKLFISAFEITVQQANICGMAWKVFTSGLPSGILAFQPKDLSTMPFLREAFIRLAKEFPAKDTGLSRTEYLIVEAVKNKKTTEEEIFNYVQSKEPIAFMSKTIFLYHLHQLMDAKYPVLKKDVIESETALEMAANEEAATDTVVINDYAIKATNYTNQVLNKWVDWVQLNGINRWVGGVHLSDGNMWRYDSVNRKIQKTYV